MNLKVRLAVMNFLEFAVWADVLIHAVWMPTEVLYVKKVVRVIFLSGRT